jgi:hypothetical protein
MLRENLVWEKLLVTNLILCVHFKKHFYLMEVMIKIDSYYKIF